MTALDSLSDLCSIQHRSEDAFGKEHVTSAETKRALLQAMGLDVDDEESAERSLRQTRAVEWNRATPPVFVAYVGTTPTNVPIVLKQGSGEVRWVISLEEGSELDGAVEFSDLSQIEAQTEGGSVLERRALPLPSDLPWGYHTLRLVGHESTCSLIVTPGQCWLPSQPEQGESGRHWGLASQLYLLRSGQNWGIGDFHDLRELIRLSKESGADIVGVNPLHAMFPDSPEQASPYSPSDRLLLNILYIAIEDVPEFASCAEAQALVATPDFKKKLAASRDAPLVDYTAVTALKLPLLRLLFSTFESQQIADRQQAFDAFHRERQPLLDRACTFQALRAFFTEDEALDGDCSAWPEPFRSSTSPEVARFADEHPDLIRFQMWMQWVADDQLRAAREATEGMGIGLYRDLAVGAAPSGAEVWSFPDALVSGASVGAPPDIWNPAGQNWGLPPLHPLAARDAGYRSFIELLRANMRHAGALRIDHALALQRLYWIPKGSNPEAGAYVSYQTDDLIGILALESHRNRCLVIGEDLGTVPEGFRDRMAQANILSYRVLFFERDKEGFFPPEKYPALSLSVVSSHDLPTLAGWWTGSDIDLKDHLHLFPASDGAEKARETRDEDRAALLKALSRKDLLDESGKVELEQFCDAAHRFLWRTKSLVTLVQLDDLSREEVQVNVPATSDENPNWRRKLSLSLEQLKSQGTIAHLAGVLRT